LDDPLALFVMHLDVWTSVVPVQGDVRVW